MEMTGPGHGLCGGTGAKTPSVMGLPVQGALAPQGEAQETHVFI